MSDFQDRVERIPFVECWLWSGPTIKGIHRAARKRYAAEYPGARVSFGAGIYTNSYGAH